MSGPEGGRGRREHCSLFTQSLLSFQTQAEALTEKQVLPLFWKLFLGPWRVRAWPRGKVAPEPGTCPRRDGPGGGQRGAQPPSSPGLGVRGSRGPSLASCTPTLNLISLCEVGRVAGNPLLWSPFPAAKGDTSRDCPDQAGNSEPETGGFSVLVYSLAIDFN